MFKDLIEGFVKDQIKNQITETIGIKNDNADGAIHDVIGSLIWGLANNASKPEGANALVSALDKDHDGSILDDAFAIMQSDNKGEAIINHILWNKSSGISKLIWAKNGIDAAQAQKILTVVAPIVMGYLGKKKKEDGLGLDGIVNLLSGEKSAIAGDKAESPLVAFLDQDGDGDVDIMDFLKMAG